MMGELSAAQVRAALCWAADSDPSCLRPMANQGQACHLLLQTADDMKLTHSLAVHRQAEAEASQTAGTEELARVSGGMLAWSCADDL